MKDSPALPTAIVDKPAAMKIGDDNFGGIFGEVKNSMYSLS